jgi:hypothetical protein
VDGFGNGCIGLQHVLDVGAQARNQVGGIGGEIDVGENMPGLAEDQDAPAQLYRLLELVRNEDSSVALGAREIDKRPAQRRGGDFVEVTKGLICEKERGTMTKARARATRWRMPETGKACAYPK